MRSCSSMSLAVISNCFSLTARWCLHFSGAAAVLPRPSVIVPRFALLMRFDWAAFFTLIFQYRPSLRHLQSFVHPLLAVARHPSTNWNMLTAAAVYSYSAVRFPSTILQRTQLWLKMVIFAPARLTLLPVPQTGSPSCLTSVLGEQLKKHAYLSALLLTELFIARLLLAPLYHGPKRVHSRETITEQRSWLLNTL